MITTKVKDIQKNQKLAYDRNLPVDFVQKQGENESKKERGIQCFIDRINKEIRYHSLDMVV